MVAWPGVYRFVAVYESLAYAKDPNKRASHYKQAERFQSDFFEKVLKLYSIMKEIGIPSRKRQMTY